MRGEISAGGVERFLGGETTGQLEAEALESGHDYMGAPVAQDLGRVQADKTFPDDHRRIARFHRGRGGAIVPHLRKQEGSSVRRRDAIGQPDHRCFRGDVEAYVTAPPGAVPAGRGDAVSAECPVSWSQAPDGCANLPYDSRGLVPGHVGKGEGLFPGNDEPSGQAPAFGTRTQGGVLHFEENIAVAEPRDLHFSHLGAATFRKNDGLGYHSRWLRRATAKKFRRMRQPSG